MILFVRKKYCYNKVRDHCGNKYTIYTEMDEWVVIRLPGHNKTGKKEVNLPSIPPQIHLISI